MASRGWMHWSLNIAALALMLAIGPLSQAAICIY